MRLSICAARALDGALVAAGLALLLAAPPSRAQAAPAVRPDAAAALVLQVDGGAQRRPPGASLGAALGVSPGDGQGLDGFAGLRRGESVDLAGDARLGVAYLASGVVERWRGPARFRVGDIGSNFDLGTPERTLALPRSLLDQLAHAPEVLAELLRLAALPGPSPANPAAAWEDLRQARADLANARVVGAEPWLQGMPELGLFVALYEAGAYQEADAVIGPLARRLPDVPMVAALASAFERLYRKALP